MGENAQLLELGGVGDPEVEGSMKLVLYDDYFVQRVAPKWMSGRRPPHRCQAGSDKNGCSECS